MRALFIPMLAAAHLAAQTATVEGKVTELGSGHPVRNAQVLFRGLTQTGNPPEADNYEAETDSNGHFLIEGIVPGRYQASSSHAGFIARAPGKPILSTTSVLLPLAQGQHATVNLQLIATGAISGRIVSLNGDEAGAYVEAMQYSYPSRDDSPSGTVLIGLPGDGRKQLASRGGAVSNDRGEFRIFGLAPGRYYLRVEGKSGAGTMECVGDQMIVMDGQLEHGAFLSGGIVTHSGSYRSVQCSGVDQVRGPRPPLGFGRTYYPGTRDFPHAAPLDVTPGGDLRNVVITVLREGAYTISVTMPPLHGKFTFTQPEIRRRGDSSRPAFSFGTTQDTFKFRGLLPGSYIVTGSWHNEEHPDQSFFSRRVVELVDRDVDGVTLDLAPLKTVTGKVIGEGPLPIPFSGMNVELDPDDPETPTFTTRVNADGTFITQVIPEAYVLVRPRILPAYVKSIKMGDHELSGAHIDFARLDGPLTILFGLDAGSVQGTALNAEGQPVQPAKITLIPVGANQGWPARTKIINADENGKFIIPSVAPGEYKAFAWLDADLGAPLDAGFRKPYESQGVSVKVEPNQRSSVQLKVIVTDR